ncbi:MAG: hypothetical protein DWQ09_11070 [Proteobacteria bacterium]|nr:MAG: hypothetical protein DWQ09_11070 [Pseudomonadota bacterium]
MAIADHQHVGHGIEDAFNKMLGLFKSGVLLFQRHLILEKIAVDLIHLANHFNPGRLAHVLRWRSTRKRRQSIRGQRTMRRSRSCGGLFRGRFHQLSSQGDDNKPTPTQRISGARHSTRGI